ncbi:hypothetical protein EBZ80_27515 [bacterium]|nr:hypothetical protein [bacterium]
MGEYELLNERQQEQADDLAELAVEFGKFDQTTGANGAHYAPASANPFKAQGLMCSNCVFYDELGGCQIVSGVIEPEAVCKLWIIPETTILEAEAQAARSLDMAKRKLKLHVL